MEQASDHQRFGLHRWPRGSAGSLRHAWSVIMLSTWVRAPAETTVPRKVMVIQTRSPSRVPPEHRVLDVLCDTGTLTVTLAGRVGPNGSVDGVDTSPEMIDVAQGKAMVRHPPALENHRHRAGRRSCLCRKGCGGLPARLSARATADTELTPRAGRARHPRTEPRSLRPVASIRLRAAADGSTTA